MAKKLQFRETFLLLFALVWCGMMAWVAYRNVEAWRARIEIRKILQAPDNEFVVTVNGRQVPYNGAVLRAIRGVHLRMAHHSYPNYEVPVTIQGKRGRLELTLARDSGLKSEYWVFWARDERNPNRLEIGRIEGISLIGDD